ncbi:SDR family NAD(P)-dependent oxidoreductase [Streptomyces sp. NPDC048156]|uniref:SDR family NAD(P)-dependent oxidoreductase n=1 Tax=Streptomyces sp. NPDC048156 TaxID=3365502 RepID=UPI00371FBF3F
MAEKNLDGKVGLITGGSRGIGAATARRLAAAGANVALTYRHSDEQAAAVVGELKASGVQAEAFQADQGVRDEVVRMVGEVADRFGRIDILVNNAGIFLGGGPMGSLPPEDARRLWDVNVHGTVTTTVGPSRTCRTAAGSSASAPSPAGAPSPRGSPTTERPRRTSACTAVPGPMSWHRATSP